MPMDIPEWRNVDRHLLETQILPAGSISRVSGADCSEASRRKKRHNPQPHWRSC